MTSSPTSTDTSTSTSGSTEKTPAEQHAESMATDPVYRQSFTQAVEGAGGKVNPDGSVIEAD